jgi:hypothetical protein
MSCIVCGSTLTKQIFQVDPQPLFALNLPKSAEMSRKALRFPMNFHLCMSCGHVFNIEFNEAQVPYAEDSNLMYNRGYTWELHMRDLIQRISGFWDGDGVAIDIGCGDGQFFSMLSKEMPQTKCIGYEPGVEADKIKDFEVVRDYFNPQRDLAIHKPELIVCRHVVEHLADPRRFLDDITYWCSMYGLEPTILLEVPCFNRSLETGRVSDFLYEHVSNFTTRSFKQLFVGANCEGIEIIQCYQGEVLVGLAEPSMRDIQSACAIANRFEQRSNKSFHEVSSTVSRLTGTVLFWGGTGKGAAFLNMYRIHNHYVVDSDPHKIGRFVPGTAQEIQSPDLFKDRDDLTIVIATPWRAYDIYVDIQKRGLKYRSLLVLQDGALHEYKS